MSKVTMSTDKFSVKAKGYLERIPKYHTRHACSMAISRIKEDFSASGSYGYLWEDRQAVIAAAQDQWMELNCQDKEKKTCGK